MNSRFALLAVLFSLFAMLAASGQAKVLRTVTIETDDAHAYAEQIKAGSQIMAKLKSPGVVRVWVGRFAGTEAGTVIVTIEYDNLTALAKDYEMVYNNEEWKRWLQGLSGIRRIVSDSVYEEITK